MTMLHETANTAVQLFEFHVTRLDAAQRTCPELKKFIAQARRHAAGSQRGAGLIVPTAPLKALNGFDSIGHQALLLVLPDTLEPLLPALMDTAPMVVNDLTLDVQTMLTSALWRLEGGVKMFVDIEPLNRIAIANAMQRAAVHACFGLTSIPLILCAGKSIGLGGLLITPQWTEEVRVNQEVAANHWHPESYLPPEVIAMAKGKAAKQGPRPWTGKLWTVNDKGIPFIYIPVSPYQP